MKDLQDEICTGLEKIDGKSSFEEDQWVREGGGGGRSRVMTNGNVIEKGGVNFSAVHGILPANIQQALKLEKSTFYATGVSIVLHPKNPWMPIIHMNVRYFETAEKTGNQSSYWFGGGIDLTPHYVDPEDGGYLHHQLKDICDRAHPSYYERFKKWADDYFYIKHRNETRGVGGIFYDRLNDAREPLSFDELWAFHQNVGRSFVPIYGPFCKKVSDQKIWTQKSKRGR